MQRLYSIFPNVLPGCGFLLLRLAAFATPFESGNADFLGASGGLSQSVHGLEMITSALLIAGMWVPYAASAQAIVELCSCWDGRGVAVIHLVQTALALSLAMFGRRASLLDLQLFKRKRVDLRIVGR